MIEYPEIKQYLGKPIKPSTRLIILSLIIIAMIIATIIFLISVGYINISSPSNAGQVIT
jgi:hypothetical protein